MKSPVLRIGIIGAGAAGLTAAETLKEKGYQSITVLERGNFAGGKCRSIEYKGRSYELGAGIIAGNNQTIIQLAEKAGVRLSQVKFGQDNLYDIETGGTFDDILSPGEKIPFLWQLLLKYRRLCHKYQNIQEPGFAGIDPDLFINFSEWAEQNGIELVEKNFERFFTGFGYGYWHEIPAAYVLKYYDWDTLKDYVRRGFFIFPEGIQLLWREIAKSHDVRYNSSILRIQRAEFVTVETANEQLEFDELFLAGPLDEALNYLDGSTDERALFSKIIYKDYQTYACVLDNFPQQTGFIPNHFHASKMGHPMFWYKRYTDSNFYTMYVLGDWQMTENEITQNIENSIQKLGGTLKRIHSVHRWKYFPHVTSADMLNGFYDKLENIQGFNHTYYIGELPNFSTVELSAAYAKNLVEKCF